MAQFKSSALAHGTTTSPRRAPPKQSKCGRCCRLCLRTIAVVLCVLAGMAAYHFQQGMTTKNGTATTSDLLVLGVGKESPITGATTTTSVNRDNSVKVVERPTVLELERVQVTFPLPNQQNHHVGNQNQNQNEGVTATDETHNKGEKEKDENNTPNEKEEQEEDDNDRHQHGNGNDHAEEAENIQQQQQQEEDDNDRHQHANDAPRESNEDNQDQEVTGGIPKAIQDFNTDTTINQNHNGDKQEDSSADDMQLQLLQFDANHPVFVLSLPFSKELVLPRYWHCANGIDQPGRYWTKPNPTHKKGRKPIGQCMLENMLDNHAMAAAAAQVQPSDYLDQGNNNNNNMGGGGDDDQTINNPQRPHVSRLTQQVLPKKNITENCGKFKVWTDLQFITPPLTKTKWKHPEACFDPVLYPNALAELHRNYPQATILTIQYTDPKRWYRQLPKDIKQFWRKYCNPTHNQAFPPKGSNTAAYVTFYQQYYQTIDDFIRTSAPEWKHVVVPWSSETEQRHVRTGQMLETALGIPSKCWMEAAQGTMIQPAFLDDPEHDVPTFVTRPNDFQFPILVASLPKSGTSSVHNYFKCGMGNWTTKHQWTTPTASTMDNPLPNIPIGKCFLDNLEAGTSKSMLHGCGHARVWNDIGYMTPPKQPKSDNDDENNEEEEQDEEQEQEESVCFYPTLHKGGLEAFSKAYPRGTIFHMVRNAADWAESARRWGGNLLHRWSTLGCQGFPSSEAITEDWEDFYRRHTRLVRNFAKRHPNMTYIELPLSESKTGEMLQNIFGFHPSCWGTFNQFGD